MYYIKTHENAKVKIRETENLYDNALFSGDTIFKGGLGKLFEGTGKDMYKNIEFIKSLPDDTNIFSGHEYTVDLMKWAKG